MPLLLQPVSLEAASALLIVSSYCTRTAAAVCQVSISAEIIFFFKLMVDVFAVLSVGIVSATSDYVEASYVFGSVRKR